MNSFQRHAASLSVTALALLGACSTGGHAHAPQRAVVQLAPVANSGVDGTITFTAKRDGVLVQGRVTGLTPGKHGFHVHEYGDVTGEADGKSAGGHFAPHGHDHGKQDASERHVGDLGNIVADASGTAEFSFTDEMIRLHGEHSIVGRAIVVHADEDTYEQPTGGAGPRVAFGVIGVAKPANEGSSPAQR